MNLEMLSGSNAFWAWGIATLLLATALGFVAGVSYANLSADRGLRKAAKKLSSLYGIVIEALEKAQRVARLLEEFPQVALTVEQTERLDKKRGSLLESLGRIVSRQHEALAAKAEAPAKSKSKPQQAVKLQWQRTSLDPGTNLPDRTMFDANLQLMLEAGSQSGFSSGLLLLKIDKIDQLKGRFGILGADVFLKSTASVVARAVREQDLACRLNADSFGILMPSVDADAGRKLSQAVRNSVRFHKFRLEEGGPEVLVTASFGYTTCPPDDHSETALTRAGDALSQSMRRGRNQLHVVDGQSVIHCTAG